MPSKIEWTGETWNPIRARNTETGKAGWHCVHMSEGCRNCYAEKMNGWRGTGESYLKSAVDSGRIELFLDEKALLKPLRKKAPTVYFPCSMTDMYAEFVPDEWLDKIAAVEALTPRHTYQILTKRPERMRAYLECGPRPLVIEMHCGGLLPANTRINWTWPLPNVWLGVSVEDQTTADERIPHLLNTPAALRFVSYEPALGPVDFERIELVPNSYRKGKLSRSGIRLNALTGQFYESGVVKAGYCLGWIICGGESGSNARPMHPAWARDVRDCCAAAGIPYFFKQWGEWGPAGRVTPAGTPGKFAIYDRPPLKPSRPIEIETYPCQFDLMCASVLERVGKKAAGRLLDGVEHNGMPERSG